MDLLGAGIPGPGVDCRRVGAGVVGGWVWRSHRVPGVGTHRGAGVWRTHRLDWCGCGQRRGEVEKGRVWVGGGGGDRAEVSARRETPCDSARDRPLRPALMHCHRGEGGGNGRGDD